MFRLTTYERICKLTYIFNDFLAFQYLNTFYVNARIVNVWMYNVCAYIITYLSAPVSIPLRCSKKIKSILQFQNQTYIDHLSRKKDPMNQLIFPKGDYHKIHSFLCINCQTTQVLREKRSLNLFVEVTLRRNSFPEVYLS